MECVVTHDGKQVKQLIECWHSTLSAPPGWKVAFLLLFNGAVVGVSTWGRPTARCEDQRSTLEHTRMALCGAPKNAGSWFLAANRRWIKANLPQVKRLIAYVNLEKHKGIIYLADNWKVIYRRWFWHSWNNRPGRKGTEARHRAKFEHSI